MVAVFWWWIVVAASHRLHSDEFMGRRYDGDGLCYGILIFWGVLDGIPKVAAFQWWWRSNRCIGGICVSSFGIFNIRIGIGITFEWNCHSSRLWLHQRQQLLLQSPQPPESSNNNNNNNNNRNNIKILNIIKGPYNFIIISFLGSDKFIVIIIIIFNSTDLPYYYLRQLVL